MATRIPVKHRSVPVGISDEKMKEDENGEEKKKRTDNTSSGEEGLKSRRKNERVKEEKLEDMKIHVK